MGDLVPAQITSPHFPSVLIKVTELWFDKDEHHHDAHFVFQAETYLFRVCSHKLRTTSPVFADMLSFPQPNPPELTYDGCILIRLPDSAHDITCFFKAIFIPDYFEPPPSQTDFTTVSALLRLSHKYDVLTLRRIALSHLATAYTTTLGAWDNRTESRTFPPSHRFDDEFQLLQAAIKIDAQWAMPTLFYSCCMYPMKEILHSIKWIGAGDLIEKHKCLLGYVEQFAATSRVLRFLVQPPADECITREKCYAGRLTWFEMVDAWKASFPLDIWDESNWKAFAQYVCGACLVQSKLSHRKARQAVWDNLPRSFELPAWADLEDSKALAFKHH